MLGRLSAGFTIALVAFSTVCTMEAGAATTAQTSATKTVAKKKTTSKKPSRKKHIASRGRGSYMVPPPPPYSPSILPELAYYRARGIKVKKHSEEEKPSNPYTKYVQTHNQSKEDPQPVQQGTGVVTWNKS